MAARVRHPRPRPGAGDRGDAAAAPAPRLERHRLNRSPSISREAAIADAILLFVRAPEAGRVKTRLAAEIGPAAALRVYRRLAEHAVAEAREAEAALRIHFTPADAGDTVRAWLDADATYLPQAGNELGERMEAAFASAFAAGYRRVVIIGSDLPGLTAEILRTALHLLDEHPVVLGPARDGGYYLLAMRAMVPGIFHGIPWSTGEVLACTLDRLRDLGISAALLPALADVDDAADLPEGWREWARGEG